MCQGGTSAMPVSERASVGVRVSVLSINYLPNNGDHSLCAPPPCSEQLYTHRFPTIPGLNNTLSRAGMGITGCLTIGDAWSAIPVLFRYSNSLVINLWSDNPIMIYRNICLTMNTKMAVIKYCVLDFGLHSWSSYSSLVS